MQEVKKSAVDLTDLAIGIIILGIAVSIGATILVNVRDSRLTSLSTVRTGNETITPSTAGTTLTNTWGKGTVIVTNATSGHVITSGNFTQTIDSIAGRITLTNTTATGGYGDANWNVTYDWYNTSRADWSSPDKAAIGLGEYGNWFKILVIVAVAAVVLGLIFMSFGNRSSQGGVAY